MADKIKKAPKYLSTTISGEAYFTAESKDLRTLMQADFNRLKETEDLYLLEDGADLELFLMYRRLGPVRHKAKIDIITNWDGETFPVLAFAVYNPSMDRADDLEVYLWTVDQIAGLAGLSEWAEA